jgi:hypothetical protein
MGTSFTLYSNVEFSAMGPNWKKKESLRSTRPLHRGSISGGGAQVFSFRYIFQTDTGSHSVYCLLGTEETLPGDKTVGAYSTRKDLYLHTPTRHHSVVVTRMELSLNYLCQKFSNINYETVSDNSEYMEALYRARTKCLDPYQTPRCQPIRPRYEYFSLWEPQIVCELGKSQQFKRRKREKEIHRRGGN